MLFKFNLHIIRCLLGGLQLKFHFVDAKLQLLPSLSADFLSRIICTAGFLNLDLKVDACQDGQIYMYI